MPVLPMAEWHAAAAANYQSINQSIFPRSEVNIEVLEN